MTPAASFGGLSFPYPATAAKAAAALNKTGGIDGHPIQIDVCDNQGNPNQSAACGREAKSNGDIAVVGSWDIYSASEILPVLQAEGIPYVGALAGILTELSNPDSFIFDPGAVLAAYGTAALFAQRSSSVSMAVAVNASRSREKKVFARRVVDDMLGLPHRKHGTVSETRRWMDEWRPRPMLAEPGPRTWLW